MLLNHHLLEICLLESSNSQSLSGLGEENPCKSQSVCARYSYRSIYAHFNDIMLTPLKYNKYIWINEKNSVSCFLDQRSVEHPNK